MQYNNGKCEIQPILVPNDLRKHREYMVFDYYRIKKNQLFKIENPIVTFVGPISSLGKDKQLPKENALDFAENILQSTGYNTLSAEKIGLAYGAIKTNSDIKQECLLMLATTALNNGLVVGLSVGKASTGTGDEMGRATDMGIPYIGLEFDILEEMNHLSKSSSAAGEAMRISFHLDLEDDQRYFAIQNFFQEIKEPVLNNKVGIGECINHGITNYFIIRNKPMCLHDLGSSTGILKQTLNSKLE